MDATPRLPDRGDEPWPPVADFVIGGDESSVGDLYADLDDPAPVRRPSRPRLPETADASMSLADRLGLPEREHADPGHVHEPVADTPGDLEDDLPRLFATGVLAGVLLWVFAAFRLPADPGFGAHLVGGFSVIACAWASWAGGTRPLALVFVAALAVIAVVTSPWYVVIPLVIAVGTFMIVKLEVAR